MPELSHILEALNGRLDNAGNITFGDAKIAGSDNYFSLINHRTIVNIKGVDSKKFLQGQLTCDALAIDDEQLCSGAYCTPKGRVISNFLLSQWHQDHLTMSCHSGAADALAKQLAKYIVFSKADITVDNDTLCLGIRSADIAATCGTLFPRLPEQTMQQVINNNRKLIRLSDDLFELWLPTADVKAVFAVLSETCTLTSSVAWERDIIALGVAVIDQNTVETFIPQHLNMQLNGGINFKKGCYTGQEVVARMQYRGKLKRHMYRVSATTLPPSGSALFTSGSEQSIGNMLQSCQLDDHMEGLAVLTIDSVDRDEIFSSLDRQQQHRLTTLELPYALPSDE